MPRLVGTVLWPLAFLAGAPGPALGQESPAPVKLRTVAASARQIVAKADRAFVGVVAEVRVAGERLRGVERPVAVRTVTFEVEDVLFDRTRRISTARPYAVRLFAEGSRPVARGERLLWYLAPDTGDGLTQPIGIDSGHFRFTADGRSVMNLKRNENLLEPETIRREAEVLAREVPEAQRGRFREDVRRWARIASETPSGGKGNPVPVDLLIVRTRQLERLKP